MRQQSAQEFKSIDKMEKERVFFLLFLVPFYSRGPSVGHSMQTTIKNVGFDVLIIIVWNIKEMFKVVKCLRQKEVSDTCCCCCWCHHCWLCSMTECENVGGKCIEKNGIKLNQIKSNWLLLPQDTNLSITVSMLHYNHCQGFHSAVKFNVLPKCSWSEGLRICKS